MPRLKSGQSLWSHNVRSLIEDNSMCEQSDVATAQHTESRVKKKDDRQLSISWLLERQRRSGL